MLYRELYFLLGVLSVSFGEPSKRFPPEVDLRPWKSLPSNSAQESFTEITRLPSDVIPTHYILNLRPILNEGPDRFTSPGDVTIYIHAVVATDRIIFNTNNIIIHGDSIKVTNRESGADVVILSHSNSTEDETYTLTLAQNLEVSEEYQLFIPFQSFIPDDERSGLYRGNYTKPDTNEVRFLASTQFERSDARRAFPCFDEPSFRSVFEINLGRTEDYHTLSNMRIKEITADPDLPGWVWDHYEETVNMPTYLLAFVISDYISEEAPPESFDGKISAVWSDSSRLTPGSGALAAETSAKVILYYENRFQAKFDLPKLDSASIPDFALGAMENWGLVLYRDYLLLYYNGTTNENSRRAIVSVIAHELAHQWFGNIVTMTWWNDMWLKEGFASYVTYWGMNGTNPEFDVFNWIMPDSVQPAMRFDAGTPNSQPISNDGENPATIIYSKGASIIRMMEGFLSEETFTEGLRKYLDKFAYSTAAQDELFEVLNDQAVLDGTLDPTLTVKLIMDTWTHQSGLPLVRVNASTSNSITVSQESYGPFSRKINTTALNPNDLWYVPISYHTEDDSDFSGRNQLPKFWIHKNVSSITHEVDTTKWILVNTASTGFYRVLYDDNLRQLLVQQLESNPSAISPATRSQLMDDYFRFSNDLQSNGESYASVEHALEFTLYLAQEDLLTPYQTFFDNYGRSLDLFSGSARYYSYFKEYFSKRINASLHLIGVRPSILENEGDKAILRWRLLQWACHFGLPACYDYANELRLQWVDNPRVNPVPVDLRPAIYCAIVAAGGDAGYYFVMGQYFQDTKSWRDALGCATDVAVIDMVLELSLNTQSGISKAEAGGLLGRVAMSPEGRPRLWEFLQSRFTAINAYHGLDTISEALKTLSQFQSDPEDILMLENFWSTHAVALEPISELYPQLLEQMTSLQDWMNNYGQKMIEFFQNHQ